MGNNTTKTANKGTIIGIRIITILVLKDFNLYYKSHTGSVVEGVRSILRDNTNTEYHISYGH